MTPEQQTIVLAALLVCVAGFVCATLDAVRTVLKIRRENRVAQIMRRVKGY